MLCSTRFRRKLLLFSEGTRGGEGGFRVPVVEGRIVCVSVIFVASTKTE